MPSESVKLECRGQTWKVRLHRPTISPALLSPFSGLRFVMDDPPHYVVRVALTPDEAARYVALRDASKQELVAMLEARVNLTQHHCPLCDHLVAEHQWVKRVFTATCECCGEFGLTEDAFGCLKQGTINRAAASRAVRRRFDREGKTTFTTEQLDALASADTRWRTLGEGLDILLVALAREADGYQANVGFEPQHYMARLGVDSPGGVVELARIAKDYGYLTSDSQPRITPAGWERVEHHLAALPKSRQIFVAMAFHPETDTAFTALEQGVKATGYYEAYRVDKKHHDDKIDDRILAEIRASSVLIADYTLHRHGVYYETGFAQGLGIPVIWTCRKDEIEKLHFDVRQWPMLDWTTPDELASKVRDRIMALYPPPS